MTRIGCSSLFLAAGFVLLTFSTANAAPPQSATCEQISAGFHAQIRALKLKQQAALLKCREYADCADFIVARDRLAQLRSERESQLSSCQVPSRESYTNNYPSNGLCGSSECYETREYDPRQEYVDQVKYRRRRIGERIFTSAPSENRSDESNVNDGKADAHNRQPDFSRRAADNAGDGLPRNFASNSGGGSSRQSSDGGRSPSSSLNRSAGQSGGDASVSLHSSDNSSGGSPSSSSSSIIGEVTRTK